MRRGGEWQMSFELQPPAGPGGKPRTYRVVQVYGEGHAAGFAARSRAQALRRGVRVLVHAAGEDAARGFSALAPVLKVETPDFTPRNVTGEKDS